MNTHSFLPSSLGLVRLFCCAFVSFLWICSVSCPPTITPSHTWPNSFFTPLAAEQPACLRTLASAACGECDHVGPNTRCCLICGRGGAERAPDVVQLQEAEMPRQKTKLTATRHKCNTSNYPTLLTSVPSSSPFVPVALTLVIRRPPIRSSERRACNRRLVRPVSSLPADRDVSMRREIRSRATIFFRHRLLSSLRLAHRGADSSLAVHVRGGRAIVIASV